MNELKRERKTMYHMINIYCKAHHKKSIESCDECNEFWEYTNKRLDHCPYGENKPNCKQCPVHCYTGDMKEHAKKIMRYSGPKMAYKHPILAIIYMRNAKKEIPPLPKKIK